MSETHVTWTAPAPLWSGLLPAAGLTSQPIFLRPELLRFASDSFMDEFMRLLEHDPARLAELRAQPETWRAPTRPIAAVTSDPPHVRALARQHRIAERRAGRALTSKSSATPTVARDQPLKLYQPAHGRFYLVSACLVCRMPGLPDRTLDLSAQEQVSFVVRLLRPRTGDGDTPTIDPTTCDEYALTGTGDAAAWQKITSDPHTLVPDEEQHPLFAVQFAADDGRRRRLFAGLAPVGKREVYMATRERVTAKEADPKAEDLDPREALLLMDVIEPWKQLIYRMEMRAGQITAKTPEGLPPTKLDPAPQYQEAREQAQTISWYILLDLADFLKTYLPDVWREIKDTNASTLELTRRFDAITVPQTLKDRLTAFDSIPPPSQSPYANASFWTSLREALRGVVAYREQLDRVSAPYNRKAPPAGWPTKLFPLADPDLTLGGPLLGDVTDRAAPVETLRKQIVEALVKDFDAVAPPLPLVAQRAIAPAGPAWFSIRCVFERPNCGPIAPPLVSAGSEPFQIAAFFDPDAPARPIRIAMPMDISPGGLRKFAKNTGFVMSDMLQCQVAKMGGLSFADLVLSVLPWPFHKDLPRETASCANGSVSFGMICSLSIPIITICALILLMIIVSLLDIIFHWIPFFILCLPLPGLKARPKPPT